MGYFKDQLERTADDRQNYLNWLDYVGKKTKAKVCMDCGNRAYAKSQYCYHQWAFYNS